MLTKQEQKQVDKMCAAIQKKTAEIAVLEAAILAITPEGCP